MTLMDSERTNFGTDKVEHYKWKVTGKPAEFAWIRKNNLRVDHQYQREIKPARILALAREWDWIACGAIIVALREDGEWFVIDGQHRVEAAKKRSDIQELPCLIYEVLDIKSEASGFLSSNIGRKAMSIPERFRAMLVARDPIALKIEELLEMSGRKASSASGPNTVACLSRMMGCLKANENALRRIWPLLVELTSGEILDSPILAGMFWVETGLPDGNSLSDKKWRTRVLHVGLPAIKRGITSSCSYRGSLGEKACGIGFLDAINKGIRNELVLKESRGLESSTRNG